MSSAIPGAQLRGRKPEELSLVELKRWLRCRKGASLRGNKRELVERVYLYIGHGWDEQYLFDPDGVNKTGVCNVPVSMNTVESLLTYPPAGGWTRNLTSLPDLTDSTVFDYFISKCDNCLSTARKHRDSGWNFYKSNHVKDILLHDSEHQSLLLIKSMVVKSYSKADNPVPQSKLYSTLILLNLISGKILGGKCVCKAGLGGYCKHVAATVFAVMDFQRCGLSEIPETTTSTQKLQTHHHPSVYGNTAVKFDSIDWIKHDYERDCNSDRVCRPRKRKDNYNACPTEEKTVTKEKVKQLADFLDACSRSSHLVELLNSNDCEPVSRNVTHQGQIDKSLCSMTEVNVVPSSSISCMHSEVVSPCSCNLIYNVDKNDYDFYASKVNITSDESSRRIEMSTRGQYRNPNWHSHRKLRITASKFKDVFCRQKYPPDNLVDRIINPKSFSNKHTTWGLQSEHIAVAQYVQDMERNGYTVSTRDMGLVVNPSYPFLGASVDKFVTIKPPCIPADNSPQHGCVEVKSLLSSMQSIHQKKLLKCLILFLNLLIISFH
ncbi:uncharacterized protein [Ptychodera flava]|uniref:uncharacterized protein n=1 Tax=Ptychodera flava TaxID=63121 RepID=UPI00396A096D